MPAPFSKFYLEIDNDSPGRIGQWIGWQIVKSYKDEFPDSKLQEILSMPSQDLFNKSKYKSLAEDKLSIYTLNVLNWQFNEFNNNPNESK